MQPPPVVDQTKVEQFVGKVLSDTSATLVTLLAAIGDRLGLFKELAASGPVTSADFASRTGINERYAREWLGGMATAGYIDYDSATWRFTLPPEHVPALAQETGPFFFGGVYEMLPAMAGVLDQVTQSFRQGGGVPQSAYDAHFWDGMERFSMGWFENLLTQQWIPAMHDVQVKLNEGALVADVGCGRGRGLIKMAQAFPNSRYVGYDVFEPSVDRATTNANQLESPTGCAFNSSTRRMACPSSMTSSPRSMSFTTLLIPSACCAPSSSATSRWHLRMPGDQLFGQA